MMHISLVWPNGTTTEPRRSDAYGPREPIHTSAGWTRPYHVGTDWVNIGAIKTIGKGEIIENSYISWAGWQVLQYLGVIDGVRTWVRYCHFDKQSSLSVGRVIERNTYIGNEGSTGQVTGDHLHMEIYRGYIDRGEGRTPGSTVDPRAFIQKHLAGGNVTPAPTPTPSVEEVDDMQLWIATVGGSWYLVVPTGAGKPNAVALPGDSGMGGGGAAKAGIPVIKLKDVAALKKVANV